MRQWLAEGSDMPDGTSEPGLQLGLVDFHGAFLEVDLL